MNLEERREAFIRKMMEQLKAKLDELADDKEKKSAVIVNSGLLICENTFIEQTGDPNLAREGFEKFLGALNYLGLDFERINAGAEVLTDYWNFMEQFKEEFETLAGEKSASDGNFPGYL